MEEHKHGIKTVATRTGLTQFTIRAWEKRYGVVTPRRTENESAALFRCGYIATNVASASD